MAADWVRRPAVDRGNCEWIQFLKLITGDLADWILHLKIHILKLIQIILDQLLILNGIKLFPNFDQLFCSKHTEEDMIHLLWHISSLH